MIWFTILKIDQVDAVMAVILDWFDNEMDWWNDVNSKIKNYVGVNPHEDSINKTIASIASFKNVLETSLETDAKGAVRFGMVQILKESPIWETSHNFVEQVPDEMIEALNITTRPRLNTERLINRLQFGRDFE